MQHSSRAGTAVNHQKNHLEAVSLEPQAEENLFSKQDLSPRIINPLLAYVDELQLNRKLVKIESQFGKAAQLDFADRQIEVGADDKVILALDSKAYNRLTGGEPFDYNGIINVFYRTSQKLTLPEDASLMGIADGLADWIFINDDIVNVTISDSGQKTTIWTAWPARYGNNWAS